MVLESYILTVIVLAALIYAFYKIKSFFNKDKTGKIQNNKNRT
mgnify:CR=1 FL=1